MLPQGNLITSVLSLSWLIAAPVVNFLTDWLFVRPYQWLKSSISDGQHDGESVAKAVVAAGWFAWVSISALMRGAE